MRLSVNLDHVATLRQARRGRDPDPVAAAQLAELAGAHGITVHLRGDRRHVQERDLYLMKETLRTPLNVEAAMTSDALKVMKELRPDHVTLVPERAEEVTTEGGLDLAGQYGEVEVYLGLYREAELPVSLFINPDAESVKLAAKLAPRFVELNTADFAAAADPAARVAALKRLADAAKAAAKHKLEVHAGHDLNYWNVSALVAAVPEVAEVSIGHALVARAALVGLDRAVRDMLFLLQPAR